MILSCGTVVWRSNQVLVSFCSALRCNTNIFFFFFEKHLKTEIKQQRSITYSVLPYQKSIPHVM